MGHRLCRECHQLVSEEARTCPRCGVPRPVVSDEDTGWFAKYRGVLVLALVLLAAEITWFRTQVRELAGPSAPAAPPAPVDSNPGYRSLAIGAWLDARHYSRRDRAYIGRITSLNCPDPTPRSSPLRCCEVEFVDGHREWVRRHIAARDYLAVPAR